MGSPNEKPLFLENKDSSTKARWRPHLAGVPLVLTAIVLV